ncbi:MAG: S46 family peptidase [Elusimicrobia bacterium]|nr:S46 family peptidase [Elusimicrobiota bacterium]
MKTRVNKLVAVALVCAFALLAVKASRADEGMWTFDNLPLKQLKEKYGFSPSAEWIKSVQSSIVKLPSGSASFVSPEGLIITNHHVARDIIQDLSSKENDYIKNGFFTKNMSEEVKCKGIEAKVLVSIEDVTSRVMGTVDPNADAQKQDKQITAEISKIEKETSEKTGFYAQVVKFYQGGQYHLYLYKKYNDVRLVMAPEMQAAQFGGDYDNYTYPRYGMDFAFLRIYENDKPVNSKNYFKWNSNGVSEGELLFMAGEPGTTSRLQTVAQLEFERDHTLKNWVKAMQTFTKALLEYMAKGPEEKRQGGTTYSNLQNFIKRFEGGIIGLSDKDVMAKKMAGEKEFIAKVKKDPELKFAKKSWKLIAKAEKENAKVAKRARFIMHNYGSRSSVSSLALIAETIVEYVDQVAKPNEERKPAYRDSSLESTRFRLFSSSPIYKEMEEFMFAAYLQMVKDELGEKDTFVIAALGVQSPKALAQQLVNGTKLENVEYRKELIAGGKDAVEKSADPFIVWARSQGV